MTRVKLSQSLREATHDDRQSPCFDRDFLRPDCWVSAGKRGANIPPLFIERTPESVRVDLNLGQTSFECTGTAIDFDANDTIYFFAAGLQPFITLDSFPGNPGSFRLHAENLTGAHYGGYFVDVIAIDRLDGTGQASSLRFAIGIIPEPVSLASLGFCIVLVTRSRRIR